MFEEYARWIAPIGMSPRRVAKPWSFGGVDFEPEDRVFFMFGSANRDEACFPEPDRFDITRDTQKSIAFGAGPHYCAGAFASRAMVADVALPGVFARLKGLRLDESEPVRIGGWAFRGLLNLPVKWDAPDRGPSMPGRRNRCRRAAAGACAGTTSASHDTRSSRPARRKPRG